ncbi:MAG: FIST C-terminal domain-containing protein [Planctomycetota bacterium]
MRSMRFASALSTRPNLEDALAEACESLRRQIGTTSIDMCAVFASAGYGDDLDRLPTNVHEALAPRTLLGCTGGGIVGGRREIEGAPALSLTVGHMPDAETHVVHLDTGDLPDDDDGPRAWLDRVGVPAEQARGVLVLPEPFRFPSDRLLAGLDFAYPQAPKIGGVASGSRHPGGNRVFANRNAYQTGAVVGVVTGEVQVVPILAQACKPIGAMGTITQARDHQLLAVDQMPALRFLERQLEGLDEGDRELATSRPLFLGIASSPFTATETLGPGDYLIRNIIAFDPQEQSLTIGEQLAPGRRVRFHVIDHHTAAFDLRRALHRHKTLHPAQPAGALMFTCLGRGRSLYGEPDHDGRVFREELADAPLGGFFCNGEIGPVHESTYLHGYTTSIAVFAPPA